VTWDYKSLAWRKQFLLPFQNVCSAFDRHKLGVQMQYPFANTGSAPIMFSSGFSGGVRWNVKDGDPYRNGARQLLSQQKHRHTVIRGKKISYGFFPASGYDTTGRGSD
jgi:hypothetical protein